MRRRVSGTAKRQGGRAHFFASFLWAHKEMTVPGAQPADLDIVSYLRASPPLDSLLHIPVKIAFDVD
jgi:hypothetical protein